MKPIFFTCMEFLIINTNFTHMFINYFSNHLIWYNYFVVDIQCTCLVKYVITVTMVTMYCQVVNMWFYRWLQCFGGLHQTIIGGGVITHC